MSAHDNRLPVPRLRLLATVGRVGLDGFRRFTPTLFHFLAAKRPQFRVAWGRKEIHLRRDGVVMIPRPGAEGDDDQAADPGDPSDVTPPTPFMPRHEGDATDDSYMFRTPNEGSEVEADDRPLALDTTSIEAEVHERMGERPELDPETFELPDELRNAEALGPEFVRIRDLLQSLDDVEDHELIAQLDDELYKLYKAVDYKIKRHHASEAKAELGKLFRV
jgi:hypothetical protein